MNGYNHLFKSHHLAGYAQSKKVPMAKYSVIVSGLLLFLGGLSIVFWIMPRAGMALLVLFLIPVSFMMHAFWRETDPAHKMSEQIGFMKNMALLGAILMMLSSIQS